MKVMKRNLWIVLAVVLLVALVAALQVSAAPSQQTAAATPVPVVVDTKAPEVPFLKEWQGSGHAAWETEAFRHWDADDPQEVPTSCAKCHSGAGYQDFLGADGSAGRQG